MLFQIAYKSIGSEKILENQNRELKQLEQGKYSFARGITGNCGAGSLLLPESAYFVSWTVA
jgi:hypothetical protein